MTQQYRDRRGLTYEFGCRGARLTLRFIFPAGDQQDWQIEAGVVPGARPPLTAAGMTRELALRALIGAWREACARQAASELDWDAIEVALRAVRAL